MKLFFPFLVILLIASSCTSNRYVLSDSNDDKDFLKQQIKVYKKTKGISNKPIIVLDGIPYRYSHELKEKPLTISKSDIKEISILKKEAALRIYGDFAKGGVLLITTKVEREPIQKSNDNKGFDDKNILFIVDGKIVERSFALSLNPNDIETLTVIKNKEDIMDYTSGNYDGVILIVTKE
jgi:hypothetical protein